MLQEDTESLNKLARGRTNNQMLAVINNENPNYREIQQENRELKACLEDYQRCLELVMTKYRQHAQDKIVNNKIILPDIYNKQKDEVTRKMRPREDCDIHPFIPSQIIHRQELKIKEMMAVMRKASSMDEESINKESERLVQLIKENEGLRELLQISRQYGSLNTSGTDDGDHEITQIENLKRDKGDTDEDDD